MSESVIPHGDELTVSVNGAAYVQLHHPDGRTTLCPEADVDRWLRDGWTREEHDVEEMSAQLPLLMDSAKHAVATYVADVRASGTIDTAANAAMAVAETAMEEVVVVWSRLHRSIHARYAVLQGEEPPPTSETAAPQQAPEGGA